VDVVLVVGVGEFLGFGVVDFGEDEGGEGGGLRGGGGGVFGEDGGAVGDAGAGGGGLAGRVRGGGKVLHTRGGELLAWRRRPWWLYG